MDWDRVQVSEGDPDPERVDVCEEVAVWVPDCVPVCVFVILRVLDCERVRVCVRVCVRVTEDEPEGVAL